MSENKKTQIPRGLSKRQIEHLLKLIYLGEQVINAGRDEKNPSYNEVTQYIYYMASQAGLTMYVDCIEDKEDKDLPRYTPNKFLHDTLKTDHRLAEYENQIFWTQLKERLAKRDFIREYGKKAFTEMTIEQSAEKLAELEQKYAQEFRENGIDALDIAL